MSPSDPGTLYRGEGGGGGVPGVDLERVRRAYEAHGPCMEHARDGAGICIAAAMGAFVAAMLACVGVGLSMLVSPLGALATTWCVAGALALQATLLAACIADLINDLVACDTNLRNDLAACGVVIV